jgi:peptidoglycan/LPS O-acetylase OafA/YrhL
VTLKINTERQRFYEIDLLRFIAAILVVLYHYTFHGYSFGSVTSLSYLAPSLFTKYGYLGVDLFFIISGFVILMSASSGSVRHFVIARIIRLYPAFWICCTITFIATLLIGGTTFTATLQRYAANMTMLSGFFSITPIDSVYWSLVVEMKFYILIFFVLVFRKIQRTKELCGIWLCVSIILELYPESFLNNILIARYAPYFIAGAMFYVINKEGLSLYKIVLVVASFVISVLHAIEKTNGLTVNYHSFFNPYVVVAAISVFFSLFFLISMGYTKNIFSKKCLFWGALTYPLYLIHQNVGFMIFNLAYPALNKHFVVFGTIALMLLISYLVNTRIEKKYSRSMKNYLEQRLFAQKNQMIQSQNSVTS